MSFVRDAVANKKSLLGAVLSGPLGALGEHCTLVWGSPDAVDRVLVEHLAAIPRCHLLYALDTEGVQVSSNVGPHRVHAEWRGQDLGRRPYLVGSLPYQGFILSAAYLSQRSMAPCITAVQAVRRGDALLGFVAADFDLRDLPEQEMRSSAPPAWQQFRGDPAIRGTVFQQQRAHSVMDTRIDQVLAIMEALLLSHGIFHGKLHFSSSRFTVWHLDDPCNYRLHGPEEVATADLCLAYARRQFSADAKVAPEQVRPVLHQFKALRQADETIYLRSGSLNVMNGMVGLNFSCDGSHYMPADEFLHRDLSFWLGAGQASIACE